MKKLLSNKNVLLVLAVLVLIIVILIFSRYIDTAPDTLPDLAAPVPQQETAIDTPPAAEASLPLGYILVQKNGDGGWIPLPTGDDAIVTISDEHDPNAKNVIRLSKNGFVMESSTCENQDCVDQGEVTLENMSERVLMNMVLCLPHQLSVELYSIAQLVEMSVAQ